MEEVLTPRQREFLALNAQGLNTIDIAVRCNVAAKTVENTLIGARRRMRSETLAQCVVKAIAREQLILDHEGNFIVPRSDIAA